MISIALTGLFPLQYPTRGYLRSPLAILYRASGAHNLKSNVFGIMKRSLGPRPEAKLQALTNKWANFHASLSAPRLVKAKAHEGPFRKWLLGKDLCRYK